MEEQKKQQATPEQIQEYRKKVQEAIKYCKENKLVTKEQLEFWRNKGMNLAAILLAKMEVHKKEHQQERK